MSLKSLRILYVITSLRFGGAEQLVVELSLRFKREGHHVDVFLMDGIETPFTKRLEDNGVSIHKAASGYCQMWNLWHFRKLKKILQENKYDIVHSHNTPAQILTYFAMSKHDTAIRYFTTEHNTHNRRRSVPLFSLFERKMYGACDKVVCVSDAVKSNLLNHLSLPIVNDKFVTIYNGIDLSIFKPCKIDKPEEYKDKIILLMVAAFRKQKDQPTLIRALKHLPNEYVVWLAGDGTCRKKCEKQVKKLGLENRVIFLGNRTDVSELYGMADVIVISSHYEGMSLASLEALASGKPVIASDVDGLREIVNGVGLLFREGDEKDLSEVIKTVCINEGDKEYGLIDMVTFDIKKTFAEYKNIYSQYIADGSVEQ